MTSFRTDTPTPIGMTCISASAFMLIHLWLSGTISLGHVDHRSDRLDDVCRRIELQPVSAG